LVFVVLWMFEAKAGAEADFMRAYGPEGDWAKLFRRSEGYVGTELARDAEIARRFVTIDRWASRQAFEDFKASAKVDCDALDARCQQLTRSERLIGHFEA
jgi:heme-degrading monooxygenase HmoA